MTLDCKHCSDLRARTQVVKDKTWMEGLYLIDGQNNHWKDLNGDPEEVVACPCPCHDTWRWINRIPSL